MSTMELQKKLGTRFGEETWNRIAGTIAHAFRFTEEEADRFSNARIPKLIAAIPFAAGCSFPERTALTHLGAYMLAHSTRAYDQTPEDISDPYSRFRTIMNFQNGDNRIIMAGMGRIGLVSYADHVQDGIADEIIGKYNPVNSGHWNSATRDVFHADATNIKVDEFEAIIPGPGDGTETIWDY